MVVRGVLYATSPQLKVFALDAATGRRSGSSIRSRPAPMPSALGVNRGVVYWEDERRPRRPHPRRRRLHAVRARRRDGPADRELRRQGRRRPARRPRRAGEERSTSSPTRRAPIYQHLLIQGTRVGEGPGPSAPGYVRAYDVRTGRIAWTFHTIPQPGEHGPRDLAGRRLDARRRRQLVERRHRRRASAAWCSCRPARRRSTSGAATAQGDNLYANSLLVLRADTGAYVWHYQFVRHDIWDRDLPQSPVLVTVRRDGRAIPAVAQATKTGHVYVFDRETGAPLFPMEEQPVPPSDLEGEAGRGDAARADGAAGRSRASCSRKTRSPTCRRRPRPACASAGSRRGAAARGRRPSTQGTIIFPGFDGGAEWGGSAYDERVRPVLRQRQRDAVDPADGEAGPGGRRRAGRAGAPTRRSAAPATARTARAIRCAPCRRSTASRAGCRAAPSPRSSRTGGPRCRRSRSSRPPIARR